MKQLEQGNQKFPQWSFEEDMFLRNLIQEIEGEVEWQNISKKINKKFHQNKPVRKSKQTQRRWQKVVSIVLQRSWNRSEAQKFIILSQQYCHTSRRFWNRLKKEFQTYTYKMLKHKFQQLNSMSPAQFVLLHECNVIQRNHSVSDTLGNLCVQLEQLEN